MARVWEGEGAATSWPPGRLAYGEYTRILYDFCVGREGYHKLAYGECTQI